MERSARVSQRGTHPSTHTFRWEALSRVLVLALTLTLQVSFFPWFPKLMSPNELTRVYLASALVEDRSVDISRQVKTHGSILDLSTRSVAGRKRYYSDKAPGVAMLSAPVLWLQQAFVPAPSLEDKVRLVRLWAATLPTLLLLLMLGRALSAQGVDARLGTQLLCAYGLGSLATPYGMLAYGHQLSAAVLFALYMLLRKPEPSPRTGFFIGVLASLAVLTEYQNALLLLPFFGLFAARARRDGRVWVAAVLGALPLTGLLLAYHQAAFGSPFLTGYSFLASSFKEVHAQGLLGVSYPRLSHAYLSFLSPDKGLFYFAPWLVLALPGALTLWRSGAAELRFVVIFVALYALFVSSLVYPVGGWTVSQRHLSPAVPFMALAAGVFLSRHDGPWLRALSAGLILPSIVVCSLSAALWPHYQESLKNPFWQLGVPVFLKGLFEPERLPGMSAPFWLALAVVVLAVSLVLALAASGLPRARTRWLVPSCAVVLGATLLGLARLPARDQPTQHYLRFVEQAYRSAASSPR
jgi:hypothetical protein